MTVLSPIDAADIGAAVYAVKLQSGISDFLQDIESIVGAKNTSQIITGRSGICNVQSNFGAVVQAPPTGKYANDTIVAIRGTMPAWIFDVSTDLYCGLRTDNNGQFIHAGFERTINSIWPQIENSLRKNPCRGDIHVIGHSLGGAVASLTASKIKAKLHSRVKLYTFGAPRVGLKHHAEMLTCELGNENIYRVHHHNDPVAMVPTWPFMHAPLPGTEYCLPNSGIVVNPLAHSMNKYVLNLEGHKKWDNLQRSYKNWYKADDEALIRFLENHTDMSITMRSMFMLNSAIQMVVRKAMLGSGIGIGACAVGSFTVLDQMFLALSSNKLSVKTTGYVRALLSKLLRYAGIHMPEGQSITSAFVKWVFERFQQVLVRIAGFALKSINIAA